MELREDIGNQLVNTIVVGIVWLTERGVDIGGSNYRYIRQLKKGASVYPVFIYGI